MLCCTACGAYAWKRAEALTETCLGRAAGPGLRAQRVRLSKQLFPSAVGGPASVGRLHRPTRQAVLWLVRAVLAKERLETTNQLLGEAQAQSSLTREQTLHAFGLTEEALEGLAQRVRAKDSPDWDEEE